MRFRSGKVDGYQIFAVTGVNTVSFGIDFSDADTNGLLGFAVERLDPVRNHRYFLYGFKVFPSVFPSPAPDLSLTTYDHPIQSFVYDDFTARPGQAYEYRFHPLKGMPRNLDRSARPIPIKVRTEPLFSDQEHDVFFNRGVASSQAYVRRFNNRSPGWLDKHEPAKAAEAREWLSRRLDDALLRFIAEAAPGDGLLCCFYEFRYRPVAEALKAALDRGVAVRIIVDAKANKPKDRKGNLLPSFPRTDNLDMIQEAKLPRSAITLREARPNVIQHNKFMVLLKGAARTPSAVWTGSTNLSDGGFHGQTNVGHWLRNPDVAAAFRDYWDLLSTDPGPAADADTAMIRRETAKLRKAVERLGSVPLRMADFPVGTTPVFSPRRGLAVLDLYAAMADEAKKFSCVTLAFGISDAFKKRLIDNTPDDHIVFLLLEKEDKKKAGAKKEFVAVNAANNVYKAWGSYLRDPLYQWARETHAKALGLNRHVSYIHSKFLLVDPFSADPYVITGSANFSPPSTVDNDENMLIIRGDRRAADIYATEFFRIFYHYYFRSVQEKTRQLLEQPGSSRTDKDTLFLSETDAWIAKYKPGSLKLKRVDLFRTMAGAEPG
jgi:phosphatidylserine/phosphatidylglycerophosphate/cardiolipin synthase-like enzyme